MKQLLNDKGYTLTELLIVASMILILLLIGTTVFTIIHFAMKYW